MAIQVVAQVAAKVGQVGAKVGATAGRVGAKAAQAGARAGARGARQGVKAGAQGARAGARQGVKAGGQTAGKAARGVRTHGPKPRDPRRPGQGPKLRDHTKGARDPRRPGQGPQLRKHQQPNQAKQGKQAKQPKELLKSDAKGLNKLTDKAKPHLNKRLQRGLKRQARDTLRGNKDDKPKSGTDKIESKLARGALTAAKGGAKFVKRRIRRMVITEAGDKLLEKSKKFRRRVLLVSLMTASLLVLLPVMLALIVVLTLSEDETAISNLAAQIAAAQPPGGGGIPAALLDEVAAATGIPLDALTAYSNAASNPDWAIDWTILAGIGFSECSHGKSAETHCTQPHDVWLNTECSGGVCGSGERGPMQHLGHLWRVGMNNPYEPHVEGPPTPKNDDSTHVASDGDGDGIADPWDWDDAALGTARKLTLYRKELRAKNTAYDTDEFMIAAYNAGVSGATANGTNPANIDNRSYVTRVENEAERIRKAVEPLDLPAIFVGGAACPAGGGESSALVIGSTEPIADSKSTKTNMAVANAAIKCFGRGSSVGCYSPRPGDLYEHPRGRACDYMRSRGGTMPDATQKANGTALAEWAVANHKNLNILYVIWYGKIWSVGRDPKVIPWSQWRDYGSSGVTAGHYDHVHISVKLMPGDPPHAHCSHSRCTE